MAQRKNRGSLSLEVLESRTVLSAAVALTATNQLLLFDTNTPDQVSAPLSITGLMQGERVLGIDYRPATGELFSVTSANRMLVLNTTTGAATPVGTPFATPLVGTRVSIDFNPTVDRIRLVTDAEQNLRLNPENGQVAAVDGMLWYSHADPLVFTDPSIVAAAYLNNFNGATDTLLFVIDAASNTIALQAPPNNGTLNTVGSLGFDVDTLVGFDVVTFDENIAYAMFSNGAGFQLYRVDIFESQLTLLGLLNTNLIVTDLALDINQPGSGPVGGVPGLTPDLIAALALGQETAPLMALTSLAPSVVETRAAAAMVFMADSGNDETPVLQSRPTETAVDSLSAEDFTLAESLQG